MKQRGQITITALGGIVALVTAIVAPATYLISRIGTVETTAAVLDSRVTGVEEDIGEIKTDIKSMRGLLDTWAKINKIPNPIE